MGNNVTPEQALATRDSAIKRAVSSYVKAQPTAARTYAMIADIYAARQAGASVVMLVDAIAETGAPVSSAAVSQRYAAAEFVVAAGIELDGSPDVVTAVQRAYAATTGGKYGIASKDRKVIAARVAEHVEAERPLAFGVELDSYRAMLKADAAAELTADSRAESGPSLGQPDAKGEQAGELATVTPDEYVADAIARVWQAVDFALGVDGTSCSAEQAAALEHALSTELARLQSVSTAAHAAPALAVA